MAQEMEKTKSQETIFQDREVIEIENISKEIQKGDSDITKMDAIGELMKIKNNTTDSRLRMGY